MQVFLSWSGERSEYIAETLRDWIPNVLQFVEPWLSSQDIGKGTRWNKELSDRLEEIDFGIVCLTPENLDAPWILFEAGALSKSLDKARVCPLLYELKPTDVEPPLSQFQLTTIDKLECKSLIHSINKAADQESLARDRVDASFDKWWDDLEAKIDAVPVRAETPPKRDDRELLEELLRLVRALPTRLGTWYSVSEMAEERLRLLDKLASRTSKRLMPIQVLLDPARLAFLPEKRELKQEKNEKDEDSLED